MSDALRPVSMFLGRRVLDVEGHYLGRLVEMETRIRTSNGPREYVIATYHVSHYGVLDWLAGNILVQQLAERVGKLVGYRCVHIDARRLPLSDSPTLQLLD